MSTKRIDIPTDKNKWGVKGGQGSYNILLLAYAVLLFAYRDKHYKVCNRNNYAVSWYIINLYKLCQNFVCGKHEQLTYFKPGLNPWGEG